MYIIIQLLGSRCLQIRDRDTPSKKKYDGTKKTEVRHALKKSTKGVSGSAISSPSSLDQADSGVAPD